MRLAKVNVGFRLRPATADEQGMLLRPCPDSDDCFEKHACYMGEPLVDAAGVQLLSADEVKEMCQIRDECQSDDRSCLALEPCTSSTSTTPRPRPCEDAVKLVRAEKGFSLTPVVEDAPEGVIYRKCEGAEDCLEELQCKLGRPVLDAAGAVLFTVDDVSKRCRRKLHCGATADPTIQPLCYRVVPCDSTSTTSTAPEPCDDAFRLTFSDYGFTLRPARRGIRLRECEGRPDCFVPEQCSTDADEKEPCCFSVHRCASTNGACLNAERCDAPTTTTVRTATLVTATRTFGTATLATAGPTVVRDAIEASDLIESMDKIKDGLISHVELPSPESRRLRLVFEADFEAAFNGDRKAVSKFEHLVASNFDGAISAHASRGSIVVDLAFDSDEAAAAAAGDVADCQASTCIQFGGELMCPGTSGSPCSSEAAVSELAASTGSGSGTSGSSSGSSSGAAAAAALGGVVAVLAIILVVVLRRKSRATASDISTIESAPPTLRRPRQSSTLPNAQYASPDYALADASGEEVMYDTATARRRGSEAHTYEVAVTVGRRGSAV